MCYENCGIAQASCIHRISYAGPTWKECYRPHTMRLQLSETDRTRTAPHSVPPHHDHLNSQIRGLRVASRHQHPPPPATRTVQTTRVHTKQVSRYPRPPDKFSIRARNVSSVYRTSVQLHEAFRYPLPAHRRLDQMQRRVARVPPKEHFSNAKPNDKREDEAKLKRPVGADIR